MWPLTQAKLYSLLKLLPCMHSIYYMCAMYVFLLQNIDGTVTGSWEGIRVNAIATHPDSDLVYAADTHSRIRQYSFRDKSSSTL